MNGVAQLAAHQQRCQPVVGAVGIEPRYDARGLIVERHTDLAAVRTDDVNPLFANDTAEGPSVYSRRTNSQPDSNNRNRGSTAKTEAPLWYAASLRYDDARTADLLLPWDLSVRRQEDSPGAAMTIDWNLAADVPTEDFFASLDLDDPGDVVEALETFVSEMADDRFRTWEAVIRWEQGLPGTLFLKDLADELVEYHDRNGRVPYVDERPRPSEPWYSILRKIAPRLLVEPFRTADVHYDGTTEIWPSVLVQLENHGRGLSLPDGVSQPLDVLPIELRHKLSLQCCFDPLSGLGQDQELTLANEDQRYRIEGFIHELRSHRDTVEFFGLTLTGLLQRVELPEWDRPIFVRMMCEELGIDSADAPLAPHLADKLTVGPTPSPRLPEEVIKQGLVHPDPAVREIAADYFANRFSPDPTIVPLVIQAIEQYGRGDALFSYFFLWQLAHTSQTVAWMVRQLEAIGAPDEDAESYCMNLAYALSTVRPELLKPHRRELEDLRRIAPGIHEVILIRLDYQALSPDELWKLFEEFVAEPFDEYPEFPETEIMKDLAVLLEHDQRMVSWVLQMLTRTVDDPEFSVWRQGVAVHLAGELRLSSAVPYLVPLLHDDEEGLNADVLEALPRLAADEVLAELDRRYPTADWGFRWSATTAVEQLPADRSIATLWSWYKIEADKPMRRRILRALLRNFVQDAIEPARNELSSGDSSDGELTELRIEFVAFCTLIGLDFPELDAWREQARQDFSSGPLEVDEEDEWEDDDGEEAEWDEEDAGDDELEAPSGWVGSVLQGLEPDDDEPEEWSEPIINTGRRIGRNDPCPCGSGKKYKKCCLRKHES